MKRKQIFSLVLCLIMLLTQAMPAFAEVKPRYSHTTVISADIEVKGSELSVFGNIVAKNRDDIARVTLVVYMQRGTEDGWETEGTWVNSDTWRFVDVSGSKEPPHGYYYRARAIGRVYDSIGHLLEETSVNSSYQYY